MMHYTKKDFLKTLADDIPEDAVITDCQIKLRVVVDSELSMPADTSAGPAQKRPGPRGKGNPGRGRKGRKFRPRKPAGKPRRRRKGKYGPLEDPTGVSITERDIKKYRTYINVAEANGKLTDNQADAWFALKTAKVRSMSIAQKEQIKNIFDDLKAKDVNCHV